MLYIRHTVNRLKFFLTIGTLVAICLSMFYVMHALTVHAAMQTFSWTTPDSPTFTSLGSAKNYNPDKHCINQVINVDKIPYATNYYVTPDNEVTACVYNQTTKTGSFRYASYSRWYNMWQVGYNDESFVMSFGLDQKMYRVSGLPSGNYAPLYAANFDGFIYHYAPSTSGWGQRLDIFKDIHSKLVKTSSNSYHFDTSSPEFTFKRPNGCILPTGAMATSPNGKWLVFEAVDIGIVRLNLDTLEMKRVSTFAGTHGLGSDPAMSLAINNEGDNVFMGGYYVPFDLVHVTDTCGDMTSVTNTITHDTPIAHPCIKKDLNQYVGSHVDRFAAATDFSLSDDGGVFSFTAQSWDRGKEVRASLTAPGYNNQTLEYLAMGDSYSSGEGDIDTQSNGQSYYLPMTDTGFDRCHVSSRSYPFLLRNYLTVSSDKMKSVACSSARVVFDYARSDVGYFGQGDRLLRQPNIEELKASALNNFIPGRVPQLEFVKKYQPAVVTLTGGGNDVGFASILEYCASLDWKTFVVDDTCGYAKKGSELSQMLGKSIHDQYAYTTRLLKEIHAASPDTKIYVIGYPSFIAGSMASCALNSGVLSGSERDMINEGVSYLNTVLKHAALVSGAHYVDIQNSLKGGRLCEGSEFVTGVWDVGIFNAGERFQTFHPNSIGHYHIAQTIEQSGDFSLDPVFMPTSIVDTSPPAIPDYFGVADTTNTEQHSISENSVLAKGAKAILQLSSYTLQPGSTVNIALHSDTLDLGTFTAQNDGSFEAEVTIPASLQPGYHVLTLKGFSPSGEPIEYYQFIEVQSDTPGDEDGDGVPDRVDRCNYILHWYDEVTGKDVCVSAQTNEGEISDGTEVDSPEVSPMPTSETQTDTEVVASRGIVSLPSSLPFVSPDQAVKGAKTTREVEPILTSGFGPLAAGLVIAAIMITSTIYLGKRWYKHDKS